MTWIRSARNDGARRGPVFYPVALLAVLLMLAACGGREFADGEIDDPDEIPSGPGLLSGEDGAWTIGID